MTISYNSDKLKRIIQYICANKEINGQLGDIKINKCLWFFDKFWYISHRELATSLTHYQRMPRGPMIPDFYDIMNELEDDGLVKKHIIGELSFRTKKYASDKKPNDIETYLTEEQIALLDDISDVIANKLTASEVSELSHQNCWRNHENGDYIAIEDVLWDDDIPPSKEMRLWGEKNKEQLLSNAEQAH